MNSVNSGGNLKVGVTVRRFEPRDFSEAVKLDVEAGGDHDPYLLTFFFENYPTTFLVAETGERVAGMVLGFRQSPLEGRVFWLAVRSGERGQGVGRRLMTELLEIFRRLGVISVILEVRAGNKRAQRLYLDLGFEIVTACNNYYPDGEGAIIMRRLL
ncbi:MAG TPA: GNAT family N-acetyltransferase [Methanothrix sp.]|nr:GNAT family N-acetyltransferase [Methanothrix sp.]HPJ83845.1 GNAT family N-acetyltransferase [Methanothrix sp.]HPR65914.1 GNAT family N-acetyltransferase [Methanothrix sp.]